MKKTAVALFLVFLLSLAMLSAVPAYAEQETGATSSETDSAISEDSPSTDTSSAEADPGDTSSGADVSETDSAESEDDTSSKTGDEPPVYEFEDDFDFNVDEDGEFVEVTEDTLSKPKDETDGDADTDGDGVTDAEEEKTDSRVANKIKRVIWIPVSAAVLSLTGLIVINVLYRKKYGRITKRKKFKK